MLSCAVIVIASYRLWIVVVLWLSVVARFGIIKVTA